MYVLLILFYRIYRCSRSRERRRDSRTKRRSPSRDRSKGRYRRRRSSSCDRVGRRYRSRSRDHRYMRRRSHSRSRERSESRSSYSRRRHRGSPSRSLSPLSRKIRSRRATSSSEQIQLAATKVWDGFQWVDRAVSSYGVSGSHKSGQSGEGSESSVAIIPGCQKDRRVYVGNLPGDITCKLSEYSLLRRSCVFNEMSSFFSRAGELLEDFGKDQLSTLSVQSTSW